MTEERYFIFNHTAAFEQGRVEGLSLLDGDLQIAPGHYAGVFVTPVLNSRKAHNRWQHCLSICAIPPDGRVVWRFFAIDSTESARRLSQMFADNATSLSALLRALAPLEVLEVTNAQDFLLQGIRAQYVVCVVELLQQGSRSPCLTELKIVSAWENPLGYLPAIYQEEGSFLDRYLRIFFSQYLNMEQRIEELPSTLDPRIAPPHTLRWLARIIHTPHVELWETEALRTLLLRRTYARKGTLLGLVELLEIFTGYRPYVVERFRMKDDEGRPDPQYADAALHILLPPEAAGALPPLEALHRVVSSFVPEALTWRIHLLREGARVGEHSHLNISAHLAESHIAVIGTNAQLDHTEMGE